MPALVLVQDKFIKLLAMAEKVDSWTVHLPSVIDMSMYGAATIFSMLFTLMMLESDVKVSLRNWYIHG